MNRFEYIDTLKRALQGLPADVIAATVSEYEQRIATASAAGTSEEEIMAGLEDPQAVAAQRRASMQIAAFKQNKTPVNFFRLCFSLVGLMVFNLFLIVPAVLYSLMLVCGYIAALACYGGGIIATAVSIAGVNEISLDNMQTDTPIQHVQIYMKDKADGNKLVVNTDNKASTSASSAPAAADSSASVNVGPDRTTASAKTSVSVGPNGVRITDGNDKIRISGDNDEEFSFDDEHHGLTFEAPGMHIYSPHDSGHVFFAADHASRPAQMMIGLLLILMGIAGFLLCLVISRYSVMGVFRLAQMEFAVLKNA